MPDNPSEEACPRTTEFVALARLAFDHIEGQVAQLQEKARTYLTVNGLLVTAGLLSISTSLPAELSESTRNLIGYGSLALLLFVAFGFWFVLTVLSVREFRGPLDPVTTFTEYHDQLSTKYQKAVFDALSGAFELNRALGEKMAKSLTRAVFCTKLAFLAFVAVMSALLISQINK